MVVTCELCDTSATTNDEKFYLIRITDSGKDFTIGMTDRTLCASCLADRIDNSTKRGRIQSILRIENPMM